MKIFILAASVLVAQAITIIDPDFIQRNAGDIVKRRESGPSPGIGHPARRDSGPSPGTGHHPKRDSGPSPGTGHHPKRDSGPSPGTGHHPKRDSGPSPGGGNGGGRFSYTGDKARRRFEERSTGPSAGGFPHISNEGGEVGIDEN